MARTEAKKALLKCMEEFGSPMNMRDLILAKFYPGMQPEWLRKLLHDLVAEKLIERGKDLETGYLTFRLTGATSPER